MDFLSTPCNGFREVVETEIRKFLDFQLHAMDSMPTPEIDLRDLGLNFQLHVMDSKARYEGRFPWHLLRDTTFQLHVMDSGRLASAGIPSEPRATTFNSM